MSDDIHIDLPESEFDLTKGTDYLKQCLQRAHPDIPVKDLAVLGNAMMVNLGDSVLDGNLVGTLKRSAEGIPQLKLWNMGKK